MRVLIAGGRGFLGTALKRLLLSRGHRVKILSRFAGKDLVQWNGTPEGPWTQELVQSDAVVNACGFGLEHWPWIHSRKRQFLDSRVLPGRALAIAIARSDARPVTFIQFSGINRYGLDGEPAADEDTPAAHDFLAQLTIPWEDSTSPVEQHGVRRVIARNAVVLDRRGGLFPLMCLPARLFLGGRLGNGQNVIPWIHLSDHARALVFLLEHPEAVGAFNLVAPAPSSQAELMQAVCVALRRPYWFHAPGALLRLILGEMGDLVLKGRACTPRRLLQAGFHFEFSEIKSAARDLLSA